MLFSIFINKRGQSLSTNRIKDYKASDGINISKLFRIHKIGAVQITIFSNQFPIF